MTNSITQALEEDKTTYGFDVQEKLDKLNRQNPHWRQMDPNGKGVTLEVPTEFKTWDFFSKGNSIENRGKVRTKSAEDRRRLAQGIEEYDVDPDQEPIYYNHLTKERSDGQNRESTCSGKTKLIDNINGWHAAGLHFPNEIIENEFCLIVNNWIGLENKDNGIHDIERMFDINLPMYIEKGYTIDATFIRNTLERYAKGSSISKNALTLLISRKIFDITQKNGEGGNSWIDRTNTEVWFKEVVELGENGTEIDPMYDLLVDNSSIELCFVCNKNFRTKVYYIEQKIKEAMDQNKNLTFILTVEMSKNNYTEQDVANERQKFFDNINDIVEPYIKHWVPTMLVQQLPYNKKGVKHCTVCHRNVHKATNKAQLLQFGKEGKCAAYFESEMVLLGIMDPSIEMKEHESFFKGLTDIKSLKTKDGDQN